MTFSFLYGMRFNRGFTDGCYRLGILITCFSRGLYYFIVVNSAHKNTRLCCLINLNVDRKEASQLVLKDNM